MAALVCYQMVQPSFSYYLCIMIALVNGKFYGAANGNGDGKENLALIIEGRRIVGLCSVDKVDKRIPQVDLEGCIVAPGFIDLLANGAGGGAFGVTAQYTDLLLMGKTMMEEGTTGFLAAAPSNILAMYLQMQQVLTNHADQLPCNFLGMHLEGPYLSKEFRGAHPEDCVRNCTDDELHKLLDRENSFVRLMTVAPERINTAQLSYLQNRQVKVSFGHSAADYYTALCFFDETGCSVTHIYNGMPPIHHRKPGHIPAIFYAKPMTGIIVDGEHVAYPMVRLAYDIMPDSLYLFTDRFTECSAMGVSCDPDHGYFVRTTPDGGKVMCGSGLTMLQAVRNSVEHVGISLSEALRMASLEPAKVLGIDNKVGLLKENYLANLVVFDEDWTVNKVMFEGKWISL